MRIVKWGILSTARIGTAKVIPAMHTCKNLEIVAIASRDKENAEKAAKRLDIPKYYGD